MTFLLLLKLKLFSNVLNEVLKIECACNKSEMHLKKCGYFVVLKQTWKINIMWKYFLIIEEKFIQKLYVEYVFITAKPWKENEYKKLYEYISYIYQVYVYLQCTDDTICQFIYRRNTILLKHGYRLFFTHNCVILGIRANQHYFIYVFC